MFKFADIHCHPSLHPFAWDLAGKKRNENVWDDDRPKPGQRKSQFPEYTQTDFRTLARGGGKLIFASVYPIEQGWFKPKVLGDGGFTDLLARIISRLPVKFVNMVQQEDYRYFDFFAREYLYMNEENTKAHKVDGEIFRYIILKPDDDIEEILGRENTIGVIMSVEGAQSFIPANAQEIDEETFSLQLTLQNIRDVKSWAQPPLYVTLAHHFNNGLCGHARSFPGIAGKVLDQSRGLDDPLNDNGKEVIECLLGIGEQAGNGRRILIDTKHMSVAARKDYYAMIRQYNEGKQGPGKIPIIVSHTGYSGHTTLDDALAVPDSDEKYETSTTFNNWSINLCDEEIIEVFNSNGLIGLNFDERILSGKQVMDEYASRFSKRDIRKRKKALMYFWAGQMLNNILGIVKAVVDSDEVPAGEKFRIWDMIALGTDFDGMINPEDAFITAEEFPDLLEVLQDIMPSRDNITHLLQGLSLEDALDRIMYGNAFNFAIAHYRNS